MSTLPPRSARKGAYHHGDLRNALLAAARQLVVEAGIDGFGLREVSRRAGVSHTAAYNHFANRSALVEALVVEAFARLEVTLRHAQARALAANRSALERLRDVGVAYVLFAFEHPAEFRFMFRPELCPNPAPADARAIAATARDAYAPLVESIAACLEAGTLAGDPETLALTAWSSVHGLASLLLDGPFREEARDLARVTALARAVTDTIFLEARTPRDSRG
jgi:AcrR family transcriptional regulator